MSIKKQELVTLTYSKKRKTDYYLHIQCRDEKELNAIKLLAENTDLPFASKNLIITIFPHNGIAGIKGYLNGMKLCVSSEPLMMLLEQVGNFLIAGNPSSPTEQWIQIYLLDQVPYLEEKEIRSAILQLSRQLTVTQFMLKQYFPTDLHKLCLQYFGQLFLGNLYDKSAHKDYVQKRHTETLAYLYRSVYASVEEFSNRLQERNIALTPIEMSHLRYLHGALLERQTLKMRSHFFPLLPQTSRKYLVSRYHHRIKLLDANHAQYNTEKRFFVYAEICILYLLAIQAKGEPVNIRIQDYLLEMRNLFVNAVFRPELNYRFLETFWLYDMDGRRSDVSLLYFTEPKQARLVMPMTASNSKRLFANPAGITMQSCAYPKKIVTIGPAYRQSGGVSISENTTIQISCASKQEGDRLRSACELNRFAISLSNETLAHRLFFKPAACPGLPILKKIIACIKTDCLCDVRTDFITRFHATYLMNILLSPHKDHSTDFKLVAIHAFVNHDIKTGRCSVQLKNLIVDALSVDEQVFLKKHAQLYGKDKQLDYRVLEASILESLSCIPEKFATLSEASFQAPLKNACVM